jgi:hypothetical protein
MMNPSPGSSWRFSELMDFSKGMVEEGMRASAYTANESSGSRSYSKR